MNTIQDLVGISIGVLDDEGNIIKDITITKVKEVGDDFVVVDEDGELWSSSQLNLSFSLTPEAALWHTLTQNNLTHDNLGKEFDFETYHELFANIMQMLIDQNILVAKEPEDDQSQNT